MPELRSTGLGQVRRALPRLRAGTLLGFVGIDGGDATSFGESLDETDPDADRRSTALERLGLKPADFCVATAHRPCNVDEPERLRLLLEVPAGSASRHRSPSHFIPAPGARLEAGRLLDDSNGGVFGRSSRWRTAT
jgi:hypothetical protein